jgi:ubiquinone/menaquinone biosynthesis C-methylase UbiE
LEIACGTGVNFPHYHPEGCRTTAIDVSPAMLEIAERPAEKLGLDVTFRIMD